MSGMLLTCLLLADIYGTPTDFMSSTYDGERGWVTVNSYFYDDTSEGPVGVPENGSATVYEILYGGGDELYDELTDFDVFMPDTASSDILLTYMDNPLGDLLYDDYQAPEASYNLEETSLLSWDWGLGKGLQSGQTAVLIVFSSGSQVETSNAAFFSQSSTGALGAGTVGLLVPSMSPAPSTLALMSLPLILVGRSRKN
jgi:hypothetical protein